MEQYTQEFPFGLKTLRDTLVEIPQAEWTYVQRLRGLAMVPAWEERPFARFYKTDFAPLDAAFPAQVEETTRTLREIHHRAQAMAMLRQLGVPAQDLDYSFLMYDRTPPR